MSIIGTRPPLISETNFYELHHRATELRTLVFEKLEQFQFGELKKSIGVRPHEIQIKEMNQS